MHYTKTELKEAQVVMDLGFDRFRPREDGRDEQFLASREIEINLSKHKIEVSYLDAAQSVMVLWKDQEIGCFGAHIDSPEMLDGIFKMAEAKIQQLLDWN